MHKSSMIIKTTKYSLRHAATKMQWRPVKQTTLNGFTLCDLTSNRIIACLFLNSQLSMLRPDTDTPIEHLSYTQIK